MGKKLQLQSLTMLIIHASLEQFIYKNIFLITGDPNEPEN
jgi:hypothetical protein